MLHIPKRLLPDIMTVEVPDTDAAYGGHYLKPRTISHVRFESAEQISTRDFALADGATGRIFVDSANSEGSFEVPIGSRVTIGENRMTVLACHRLVGFSGVHHWELDVQ